MKDFLSKIAAISLAILVFISSSYVVIDTHFCCGNIIDSSIFGKADLCKMDMASCRLESDSSTKIKDNCCNNSKDYKFAELFKKSNPINFEFQQFNFTPSLYLIATSNLFIESEFSNSHFKDYSPPLITRDILVLVQRFQI